MDYFFFGVDVSKDSLDYCVCKGSDKSLSVSSEVSNDIPGLKNLLKAIEKYGKDNVWVCFEHTGNYGLLLESTLEANQVKYSAVPSLEIIKSSGLARGKSDAVDARRIATYAATFSHKLKNTHLAEKPVLEIKALLTVRDQLVRVRTQFKNASQSLAISSKIIDVKEELRFYNQEIKRYDKKVNDLDKKIKAIITNHQPLKSNYDKVIKITGIGHVIAASLIIYTKNFTCFDNPRQFNSYCGLAPFEHSSGTSVKRKPRTSMYRNRTMKKLMFTAAKTAQQHDPQIKAYYKKKRGEGKDRMVVTNAIACKLVYRIFAVLKREEPYVKFSM